MGTPLIKEKSTLQDEGKMKYCPGTPYKHFRVEKKKIYTTFFGEEIPNLENYSKNFSGSFF